MRGGKGWDWPIKRFQGNRERRSFLSSALVQVVVFVLLLVDVDSDFSNAAGGVGLNLETADTVIFLDSDWWAFSSVSSFSASRVLMALD